MLGREKSTRRSQGTSGPAADTESRESEASERFNTRPSRGGNSSLQFSCESLLNDWV